MFMELLLIPCAIIMSLLYILCPIVLRLLIDKKKTNLILSLVLLFLFLIVLTLGVFTNCSVTYPSIKISFETSGVWASEHIRFNIFNLSIFDLCVNAIMLLPVGVIFTLFYYYKKPNFAVKKLFLWLFLIGFSCGLFIETMQFILPIERAIQLSDVLLNTISCVLGGVYFLILLKTKKRPD